MTTAAEVLRRARTNAGLSQAALARRAGVAQSVISTYEAGRREPSVPTLRRLVEATGHQLLLELIPATQTAPLGGPLGRRVLHHRSRIQEIVAEHGGAHPRVFGSVARGDETDVSDVDVLVDLAPGTGLFALGRLRSDLEDLLGARVDVVPADGLRPDVRERIAADLLPL